MALEEATVAATFKLGNVGGGSLDWSVAQLPTFGGVEWATLSPSSGSVRAGLTSEVAVTMKAVAGMRPGETQRGVVQLRMNDDGIPGSVRNITLVLSVRPKLGILMLPSQGLVIDATPGA